MHNDYTICVFHVPACSCRIPSISVDSALFPACPCNMDGTWHGIRNNGLLLNNRRWPIYRSTGQSYGRLTSDILSQQYTVGINLPDVDPLYAIIIMRGWMRVTHRDPDVIQLRKHCGYHVLSKMVWLSYTPSGCPLPSKLGTAFTWPFSVKPKLFSCCRVVLII